MFNGPCKILRNWPEEDTATIYFAFTYSLHSTLVISKSTNSCQRNVDWM